jgi:hypothetical protein
MATLAAAGFPQLFAMNGNSVPPAQTEDASSINAAQGRTRVRPPAQQRGYEI